MTPAGRTRWTRAGAFALFGAASAVACGDVATPALEIPDGVAYPLAVAHLYEGGGGRLYVAENEGELDDLSLFVREGDQVYWVEVEPTFDVDACETFDIGVLCNPVCFTNSLDSAPGYAVDSRRVESVTIDIPNLWRTSRCINSECARCAP